MSEFRNLLREAVGLDGQDEVYIVMCEVVSVDEQARTCVVETITDKTETVLEGVSLMAENNDGWLMIPKVESMVMVCRTLQLKPFVLMFGELDKILMVVGDSTVEITAGMIQLNDGSFGGLVKVEELVDKINRLEGQVNDILTAIKAVVIPLAPSGTYPLAGDFAGISNIAPLTQQSDLENTSITHGESI